MKILNYGWQLGNVSVRSSFLDQPIGLIFTLGRIPLAGSMNIHGYYLGAYTKSTSRTKTKYNWMLKLIGRKAYNFHFDELQVKNRTFRSVVLDCMYLMPDVDQEYSVALIRMVRAQYEN